MKRAAARTAMMTAKGLDRLGLAALCGAPPEVLVEVGAELVEVRRLEVEARRVVVPVSVEVLSEVEMEDSVTVLVIDSVLELAEVVGALVELAVETVGVAVTSELKVNRSE